MGGVWLVGVVCRRRAREESRVLSESPTRANTSSKLNGPFPFKSGICPAVPVPRWGVYLEDLRRCALGKIRYFPSFSPLKWAPMVRGVVTVPSDAFKDPRWAGRKKKKLRNFLS